MTAEATQLALDFEEGSAGSGARPVRSEARDEIVRLVEYAPFPRARADQHRRVGFTRDISASGMSLVVTQAPTLGSLLQVTVRCIDGQPTLDSLARVVWSRALPDGEFGVGVRLVGERRIGMRPVRRGFVHGQAVA